MKYNIHFGFVAVKSMSISCVRKYISEKENTRINIERGADVTFVRNIYKMLITTTRSLPVRFGFSDIGACILAHDVLYIIFDILPGQDE